MRADFVAGPRPKTVASLSRWARGYFEQPVVGHVAGRVVPGTQKVASLKMSPSSGNAVEVVAGAHLERS